MTEEFYSGTFMMEISDREYRHTKKLMFWGGFGCGSTLMLALLFLIGWSAGY